PITRQRMTTTRRRRAIIRMDRHAHPTEATPISSGAAEGTDGGGHANERILIMRIGAFAQGSTRHARMRRSYAAPSWNIRKRSAHAAHLRTMRCRDGVQKLS
ncbi:MAG: hypothetical protein RML84_11250, partial [Anaerolineae bacterium]|nr:hypothetical protein [Anaerolineae bacterium]